MLARRFKLRWLTTAVGASAGIAILAAAAILAANSSSSATSGGLARAPNTTTSKAALAGSPASLSGLHQQAGKLLGSLPELQARIRAMRGYPIVINAWASWCDPCREEFGLFATASARYGREVAFLGANTDDSSADAQSFLTRHPVSYPSYQDSTTGLASIVPQGIVGLPTTIYIDRAGKAVYVHSGQYESQGALDQDISSHVLSG